MAAGSPLPQRQKFAENAKKAPPVVPPRVISVPVRPAGCPDNRKVN